MKKRNIFYLFSLLVIVFGITACSSEEDQKASETKPTQSPIPKATGSSEQSEPIEFSQEEPLDKKQAKPTTTDEKPVSSNKKESKPIKESESPNIPSTPSKVMPKKHDNKEPAAKPKVVKPPNSKHTPPSIKEFEQEVVKLVNIEREKHGLKPLQASSKLSEIARTKSVDMKENGYFSHQSPTYGSPFEMLKEFDVSYQTAGENIAAGQTTAKAVMDSWMNSDGHRKNILSPSYTHMGVGYTKGGAMGTYWTQIFVSY
ncbi:CAP domain-containing protein [Thermoflavimicrobium daqui]|nr:CAP domain-containing protein [Thermoflavimicrobium daqui]